MPQAKRSADRRASTVHQVYNRPHSLNSETHVPNIPNEAERAMLIQRVTAEAQAFFASRPDRNLYAGYLGEAEPGKWAYLVMERTGPYGGFEFEPPSGEFTREQFTTLLNSMPRGEQVMRDAVARVGGTVQAGVDAVLKKMLSMVPTNPTRH
ncbi:hypothetical protein [Paraburkholderia tropica]|uniref:hypothetical protein n=1 Tax=Paraburkholderia tropica TaxID=92647 RepID=UPI00160EC02E|nr:hypothetical protein [Paraburkholderia tropica]MBB2977681.1 hypothetical protein [Paraburkholderia tropica]